MIMPLFSIYFLLIILGNAGVPISSGYIGELQILVGIFNVNELAGLMGAIGMVITGAYSFNIYSRIAYGVPMTNNQIGRDINRLENAVLVFIVIAIYALGLKPFIITNVGIIGLQ